MIIKEGSELLSTKAITGIFKRLASATAMDFVMESITKSAPGKPCKLSNPSKFSVHSSSFGA